MQNEIQLPPPPLGPGLRPTAGRAYATAHHGEILQGVFEGPDGGLTRGLVSLMCDLFKSSATFEPVVGAPLRVEPSWKTKAYKAAQLTLSRLGARHVGGWLRVESDIPVGWGLGSSTSDVTATIRAVAAALGEELTVEAVAQLAVKAEVASDPLMFGDRAVLFGHRRSDVIEDFGGPLPALEVLGFNTDPTQGGIDTLGFPPARYKWWEVEAFRPLVGMLRRAVREQDARAVGLVATSSARINQRHLPTPQFDRLEQVGERAGALGIQVAHSGTVAGLLFDPADATTPERIEQARALIAEAGFAQSWRFRAGHRTEVTKWKQPRASRTVTSTEASRRRPNFLGWSSWATT